MQRCFPPLLVSLSLLLTVPLSAQVDDDSTDGDFANAPAWSGSAGLFTVVDDGGNQRLRSNSPGAANYYLSKNSTLRRGAPMLAQDIREFGLEC